MGRGNQRAHGPRNSHKAGQSIKGKKEEPAALPAPQNDSECPPAKLYQYPGKSVPIDTAEKRLGQKGRAFLCSDVVVNKNEYAVRRVVEIAGNRRDQLVPVHAFSSFKSGGAFSPPSHPAPPTAWDG